MPGVDDLVLASERVQEGDERGASRIRCPLLYQYLGYQLAHLPLVAGVLGTTLPAPASGTVGAFTISGMTSHSRFTLEEARAAGERIGVDWGSSQFDLGQFRMGMDIELEHGTRDPETNVTDDDVTMTAKIARAHLNEFPDYYTRLAKMEADAEAEANGTAPGE